MLAGLDAAVYVVDVASLQILFANARCREVFGGAITSALDIEKRFTPRLRPGLLSGPGTGQAETQDTATGSWYLVSARAMGWIDGRPVELWIATDITDRKHTEELARQQERRLEAAARFTTLGELAATIAHEVNQPLAAIANYCRGSIRRLRSGDGRQEDILDALEKAAAQADRAAGIIQRTRDFLRKREPAPAALDVNALIGSVARSMAGELERAGACLKLELDETLPPALADAIMVEQVILNLIRNAVDSVSHPNAAARDIIVRTAFPGGCLSIEVADRGAGLPAQLKSNLVTPFFSTKPEGLGMGLAICRSIVERHGGQLLSADDPAGGAVFRFTLRAAEA